MSTSNHGTDDLAGAEVFDFKLYRYDVSLPAAAASAAVFAILSALHVWRIYRHRSYYFTAFTIGGFCMTSPILFDTASHFNTEFIH
jgi:hypothetical protein